MKNVAKTPEMAEIRKYLHIRDIQKSGCKLFVRMHSSYKALKLSSFAEVIIKNMAKKYLKSRITLIRGLHQNVAQHDPYFIPILHANQRSVSDIKDMFKIDPKRPFWDYHLLTEYYHLLWGFLPPQITTRKLSHCVISPSKYFLGQSCKHLRKNPW